MAKTFFDEAKGIDIFAPEGREFIEGTQTLQPQGGGGVPGSREALLSGLPSSLDFARQVQAPITQTTQQFIKALQARQKPLDIFSQLESAAELPAQRRIAGTLRQQTFDLEDALKRVKPTVAGTTRESLVTESQRERIVQQQKDPLFERLGTITTSLGRLEGAISKTEATLAQKLGLILQGQDQDLEPFRIQLQAQQDSAARLQTGFSEDKQNFLQISLDKIRRGEQLEDIERQEAFDLLSIEKSFENTLAELRERSRLNLESALKELKLGSKLSVQEQKDLLPGTLEEFEEKLKLEQRFPAPRAGRAPREPSDFERFLEELSPEDRKKAIAEKFGIRDEPTDRLDEMIAEMIEAAFAGGASQQTNEPQRGFLQRFGDFFSRR